MFLQDQWDFFEGFLDAVFAEVRQAQLPGQAHRLGRHRLRHRHQRYIGRVAAGPFSRLGDPRTYLLNSGSKLLFTDHCSLFTAHCSLPNEPNRYPKAPGFAPLCPVRKELIGPTRRANRCHLNVSDAQRLQLVHIRTWQVEVHSAVHSRQQHLGILKGRTNSAGDIVADFVAAWSNARTDPHPQVRRPTANRRLHCPHRRRGDAGHRPAPAGMGNPHGGVHGIEEQHRQTIGEALKEHQAARSRDQPIGPGDYLAGIDDLPQPRWRKELIRLWAWVNTWAAM